MAEKENTSKESWWQRRKRRIIKQRATSTAFKLTERFRVLERLAIVDPKESEVFKTYLAKCLLVKQNQADPSISDSIHEAQVAVIEELTLELRQQVASIQTGNSEIDPHRLDEIQFRAGRFSAVCYRHKDKDPVSFSSFVEIELSSILPPEKVSSPNG